MDIELCQLDQIYLNSLSKYNKLVVERNKVLKDGKSNGEGVETIYFYYKAN